MTIACSFATHASTIAMNLDLTFRTPRFLQPRMTNGHDLDLDSVARIFAPGIDRASTPYKSIRALPGGHLLVWRAGDLKIVAMPDRRGRLSSTGMNSAAAYLR
jgi:hypothetical protein